MNTTNDISPSRLNRREFLATTAVASAGLLAAPALLAQTGARKKRYAIVGLGSRSGLYRDAVLKTYAAQCEMVGYCDTNEGRLKLAQRKSREAAGADVPIYLAKDFDRMVREQKPDVIIVTTMDSTHDRYIIRGMELGCDVMTEKPMTTDEKKCRAILRAQQKTGRKCTVTFNYRYSPHRTQVKDLLMSGVIGDILSVDFQGLLDAVHGAV
jgi:predicted dehydrogenase